MALFLKGLISCSVGGCGEKEFVAFRITSGH